MLWYEWLFWIIWSVAILMVIAYAFIIPFGAVYIPTIKDQRQKALDLLNLKPGQSLVDLGSGDGTMLVLAAKSGLTAIGYELNPFLFIISWFRTRRFGRQIKVRFGNFWKANLSEADGVYVFLITHHMKRLDRFLSSQKHKKPLKIVSNSFTIPGRRYAKKSGPMLLYIYKPVDKQG
ncbi:hypothetical protein A3F65_00240 [Candidatus Saccharibacteria bacterium RIFCSPHIGHO2_12_FULL_47_16b]|nr:MAG: hypothetical protein A3F65_00240 [Candidatus Saccharibacteria bacterium RIFCSPHIGHO2_12_FULL_47_16b]